VIREEVREPFEQVYLLIELLHRFIVRLSLQLDLPPSLFYPILDIFDLSFHLFTLSSDILLFFNVFVDYGGMLALKGLKLLVEVLSIFSLLMSYVSCAGFVKVYASFASSVIAIIKASTQCIFDIKRFWSAHYFLNIYIL